MLLLLALAALAETPTPAEVPLIAAPSATPASLIDEAVALRQRGETASARELLLTLEPLITPDLMAVYLYQRGICEELLWQPDAARVLYERVIAIGGDVALDAHFRRALVLEDLGMPEAAYEEIRTVDRARGLSEDDDLTIALQRGIAEVALGRDRVGIRRIQRALDATEGGDSHRYLRAKGRYTLASALLDEADALALTGPEKRVVKRLKGRAERIQAAEQQIIALSALQEPEWVLASLIRLGDSYATLARDLPDSTAPKRLSEAEVVVYRNALVDKAGNVKTKAFHAYDSGVSLATRLAWESPRVATLKQRRATLEAER